MAEDKYFGIAPENAADAEKQRAKQKRRKAMIENMLKDEEGNRGMKMMLEIARSLRREAEGVAKAIESYVGREEQPLSPLWILDLMHVELDVNALKVYLGVSWLPGEDDEEDDDLDDLPYGWDGPMPWDEEEEDEPDTFRERMESLCEKKITDEDCGECALLFPIPCTKDDGMYLVKHAFAKVDEEVNEWKEAVLMLAGSQFGMSQNIKALKYAKEGKARVAEEGADIMTAITTAEERMGIDSNARADAQLHVNQHNKERGRW
ncbi:MAG: hypothetical protein MSA50_10065 [Veillonellaceae bacterium]|nr:hypothetical protein [Veillonellaceae bacterium]MDD6127612.1 hypothetical protein [Veillonellaceae bacterium]